jgi:hypothetical protein
MKILLINQNWFASELRNLGHEVLSCGTSQHLDHRVQAPNIHIESLLKSLPNGFRPDRIVWHDNSAPVTILGLEDCAIPSVMYSVDTHHHHSLHSYVANSFDHILVAQKDFIPNFQIRSVPSTWFPLWASEHMEPSKEKKHGAVFVGTLNRELNPARVEFFEQLQKLVPITVMQGHFPSIFPHAEIVVNQTVKGDLNFRVFEAMMSGALLLTERSTNGLLELFEDGVHLVTYTPRDPHDAAAKISSLLADPERMHRIATTGRGEIFRKHLPMHRAAQLEHILLNLSKRPRDPRRHFGAMMNLHVMSNLMSDINPSYSCELLRLSLESIRKAITERADPDSSEVVYTAKSCLRYDFLSGDTEGTQIISLCAEAFPRIPLFGLLKIRGLLNSGMVEEANSYASSISSSMSRDEIFSSAERAAHMLMDWTVGAEAGESI